MGEMVRNTSSKLKTFQSLFYPTNFKRIVVEQSQTVFVHLLLHSANSY